MGRSALSFVIGGAAAALLVAMTLLRGGSTGRPLTSFLAPPPRTSPVVNERRLSPLPVEPASLGAESAGLRALAARGSARRGATPRTVLFASAPPEVPSYTMPVGLRRPDLGGIDDEAAGAYLAYLSQDERGHDELARALKRSGRYRAEVERILQAWHLPEDFGAIAFVLSGFQPGYVASDGGAGLWSVPEDLARAYGLVVTALYDERRSVGLATEVAAHYLADLRERFGSWPLAVCAYAVGYAAAAAVVGGSTNGGAVASDLPPACTSFVRAVTAVATVVANPDRFGLDARVDPPISTSDLEVPAGAPFALVARAAGTTAERLRELNPEYLAGSAVPNAGIAMVVHVPGEGLARAKEMLLPLLYDTSGDSRLGQVGGPPKAGANAAASAPVVRAGTDRFYYRVQDGETIEAVADRFGVSRESLAHDNALDSTAGLRPGQLLLIHAATAPSGSPGDAHAHRGT